MAIEKEEVENIIAMDGVLLDEKKFSEWLDLYDDNCTFWLPAWDDDSGYQTTDPDKEVSLIYYTSRAGLEDRIYRIGTQRSSASKPLFRTAHIVSNMLIEGDNDDGCVVKTTWVTHAYRNQKSFSYFGNTEYKIIKQESELKIKYKRINLMNDYFEDVLDFYII